MLTTSSAWHGLQHKGERCHVKRTLRAELELLKRVSLSCKLARTNSATLQIRAVSSSQHRCAQYVLASLATCYFLAPLHNCEHYQTVKLRLHSEQAWLVGTAHKGHMSFMYFSYILARMHLFHLTKV